MEPELTYGKNHLQQGGCNQEHCGLRVCAGSLSCGPDNVALVVRRGLMAVAVVWAVGGLKANWRAIRHGFVDLDNPPVDR
jgi:hypothetical protein